MECKAKHVTVFLAAFDVLIETSWNVKTADIITKSASYQVLIETSWNVKLYPGGLFLLISSINRNIVECKEKLK